MSEFRQNYATKEWVIVAPEREARPKDQHAAVQSPRSIPRYVPDCPFCPGNEEATGEELWSMRDAQGDWRVRVVRNKYSPLDLGHSIHRAPVGRFLMSDSYGTAEVVIESPHHDAALAAMARSDLVHVLEAMRDRAIAMSAMPNISIVMIFRNHGSAAGTSLMHPHGQIIASPIIPPHIRDPFQKAMLHYDTYGTCVYCDIIDEECRQDERIVFENERFVALCPFASRTPYEVRIYPRRHMANYTWISDQELPLFAEALHEVLWRMERVLADPSYNFVIRSSPVGDEDVRYLHWYFLLVPRITTPAGFEIGSGIYINPCPPERCAADLRAVQ